MKTLCLFILTFLVVFNHKVAAQVTSPNVIHPFSPLEAEIDSMVINEKDPEGAIVSNLVAYQSLVTIFNQFKVYNVALSKSSLQKIQNKKTLSGDELYLIKKSFDIFYKLNEKMIAFGKLYKPKSTIVSRLTKNSRKDLNILKGNLIWTSSHLLVLDHFKDIYILLYKTDGPLRRIVKNIVSQNSTGVDSDVNFKKFTRQMEKIIEVGESQKFTQQIKFVRAAASELKTQFAREERALFLISQIEFNKTAQNIAQGEPNFPLETYKASDTLIGLLNKLTNFLSGFFGNVAGSVKWREGYLYNNSEALKMVKKDLRPMDIILEKSPFVLTDKFIPGHYGHVAIYLGTQEELEKIDMWNHPSIVPHQEDILKGRVILEAVRSNVRLNTIEEFLNIDEFTIMRKKDGLASEALVYEQIMRGMEQIGKEYDFNFDIATLDKIVCSELIYIVFGNVTWPTAYRVGRTTITPDDVAEVLFQKGTKFNIANYVLSTKRHSTGTSNIYELAEKYDYELRAENGSPLIDKSDPTNSFWKNETKCYKVKTAASGPPGKGNLAGHKKVCKSSYKEYQYEEVGI
jgi:hypothetical protein